MKSVRLPKTLQNLINEFSKLPSIGNKSATRLAFFLMKQDDLYRKRFSTSITDMTNALGKCKTCGYFTEDNNEICAICSDESRDKNKICVVEEVMDCIALDSSGVHNGTYHILGGVLNPLEGTGPEELSIRELITRTNTMESGEIILATNPTLEGEATAGYISKQLKNPNIKISRIARGIPFGGDLEYSDQFTLQKALEGRREL